MDEVICNERGIELIRSFEGLHDGDKSTALLEPMLDPVGIWTLSYGSIYGLDGSRVTADHRAITLAEAETLFLRDIQKTERRLIRLVGVNLHENQWAAITSFAFNVGTGNFKASTLRSCLNRGAFERAADEFPKWTLARGRRLPGLIRRRAAERALFLER
tara:strand:- start:782 stop:1261 length:480 start_codon:yes stop_codon:yes gene_type:complete